MKLFLFNSSSKSIFLVNKSTSCHSVTLITSYKGPISAASPLSILNLCFNGHHLKIQSGDNMCTPQLNRLSTHLLHDYFCGAQQAHPCQKWSRHCFILKQRGSKRKERGEMGEMILSGLCLSCHHMRLVGLQVNLRLNPGFGLFMLQHIMKSWLLLN